MTAAAATKGKAPAPDPRAKKLAGKTLRSKEVRWDKRFAWLSALIVLAGASSVWWLSATRIDAPPHGTGPQGDTYIGYGLGILTVVLYALVGLYSWRHKRRLQKRLQTRTWMEIHLAFGTVSGITAILHSGPRFFGAAPFHSAFLVAWLALVITGIVGKLLSTFIPPRLTLIEDEALLVEDISDRQSAMRKEIEDLLQANPDAKFVQFANDIVPRAIRNPQSYGKRRMKRIDVIEEVIQTTKLETVLPSPLHDVGRRVVSCLVEDRFLEQMQSHHFWLRAWLPVHIALTTLCFPWLILHVITVFLL
jgi:hypothetical protein